MTDLPLIKHFGGTKRRVEYLDSIFPIWLSFTPQRRIDCLYCSRKFGLSAEKYRTEYLPQLVDMLEEGATAETIALMRRPPKI
jgi:hypothetical protein